MSITVWNIQEGGNTLLVSKKSFNLKFVITMYIMYKYIIANEIWGHGGSVVTHSPSTSEITVRIPA